MKFVASAIIVLCGTCSTLLAQPPIKWPDETRNVAFTPCQVLSYDSDREVDVLEVRARYVNGHELKPLMWLLGVGDNEIAADKQNAERELFLVLRVKPTDTAQGVLTAVKLEIDNDSPLIRGNEHIALPALLDGQYFLIKKICDATDLRDGSVGLGELNGKEPVDHVALLHKQKPKFRLRSMLTK